MLLFVVACSQEESLSDGSEDGTKLVSVNIMLPGSSTHTQTRSGTELGSDQENGIDSLFLTLDFGAEVIKKTITGEELILGQDDFGNPILTVTCEVDFTTWSNTTDINATVYANYRTVPKAITGESDFWEGEKNDKLKPLFMSGHNAAMPKENGKVELVRQVAKLRTRVGKTADCIPANLQILYKEIKVEILHVADHSTALKGDATTSINYIDYASRNARNTIDSTDYYQPNMTADSCYIHENIYKGTDPNFITTLKIRIPTLDPLTNHKEILEREYQIKGNNGFEIERNHIYTLDIKVRSQKEPLDIFLNVQPWRIQEEEFPNLEPIFSNN